MQDSSYETVTSEATSPLDVRAGGGPVAIEVRGVSKSFRIPERRPDSSSRVPRLLTRPDHRELHAVRDISFDVHKGEFFGIVGRNGSGKSTLLKILASIYRADTGRVRVAGRIAPFIELGVGFNPELTARENCEVSGVIMGLTRREARRRLDAVLDFAELRDYVELKVKNYSSGMMVRLAFAIMIQADAEIMLIDEVLAVGDASFAQKCLDVFYARRAAGRTIVLVTHDMGTVETLCHRAMVVHDGELQQIGDPRRSALCYYRLNFPDRIAETQTPDGPTAEAQTPDGPGAESSLQPPALDARVVRAELLSPSGTAVAGVNQGAPLKLDVVVEAARDLVDPVFLIQIRNQDELLIAGIRRMLSGRVPAGRQVRLAGEVQNLLVPGSYRLECVIREERSAPRLGQKPMALMDFGVLGTATLHGVAALREDVEVTWSR